MPSRQDTWLVHQRAALALAKVAPKLPPFVVVKGLATAQLLYRDCAERPLADVDLRVCPGDLDVCRLAFRSVGARLIEDARSYGSLCYELDGQVFDLESHVGAPHLARLTTADLIASTRMVTLTTGLAVPTPSHELHLLLLCVNVFKDKVSECPTWSKEDVARLLSHQETSRELFMHLTRTFHLRRVVKLTLRWLREEGYAVEPPSPSELPLPSLGATALAILQAKLKPRPHAVVTRVAFRLASDKPRDWPKAIFAAARFEWNERRARQTR
jgi:Uncharacterised nucleotidyltransferase